MKYKLFLVHLVILSLFTSIAWTMFTWYNTVMEFTDKDFNYGAILVDYTPTVEQGEILRITRKAISEPQACDFFINRYLIPINDTNTELYIGSFSRRSLPKDTIINLEIGIPYSIPPGHYLYYGAGSYYCSWVNHVFGPFRTKGIPIPVEILPRKII